MGLGSKLAGEGSGNLLQYSCLENSMDRGAWWATVHGVTKSQIRLRLCVLNCNFLQFYRKTGDGNGNPLQCSCLENPRDRGAWWAAICGVTQSQTRLKRLSSSRASLVAQRLKHVPGIWETWVRSLGWKDPLESEMATHSSILAWRIPGTGEPGGLPSVGSHRVGHD